MFRQYSILVCAALIVFSAGCKPPETTQATAAPDAASAGGHPTETHVHADGTVHAGSEPAAETPHAGNAGLTPTPALDAQIALHEAEKKKDKESLAKLYAMRGAERMNDAKSDSRKYRAALKDFRTALKYDPKNEMAADGREMLEAIYKSLNRPVPE